MAKVKKKVKEEIRKPDVVLKAFNFATTFVKDNLQFCVIGAAVFLAIGLSAYGYIVYSRTQNEKAQEMLFAGVRSFETYSVSGKEEDLVRAEGIFQKVIKDRRGKTDRIAKLYLANVYYTKGKAEDAKRLYREISRGPSDPLLKDLADRALQQIDKK